MITRREIDLMREEAKNTIRKYRAEFEKMKLGDRDAIRPGEAADNRGPQKGKRRGG